jgi:hypothetical protein
LHEIGLPARFDAAFASSFIVKMTNGAGRRKLSGPQSGSVGTIENRGVGIYRYFNGETAPAGRNPRRPSQMGWTGGRDAQYLN